MFVGVGVVTTESFSVVAHAGEIVGPVIVIAGGHADPIVGAVYTEPPRWTDHRANS